MWISEGTHRKTLNIYTVFVRATVKWLLLHFIIVYSGQAQMVVVIIEVKINIVRIPIDQKRCTLN